MFQAWNTESTSFQVRAFHRCPPRYRKRFSLCFSFMLPLSILQLLSHRHMPPMENRGSPPYTHTHTQCRTVSFSHIFMSSKSSIKMYITDLKEFSPTLHVSRWVGGDISARPVSDSGFEHTGLKDDAVRCFQHLSRLPFTQWWRGLWAGCKLWMSIDTPQTYSTCTNVLVWRKWSWDKRPGGRAGCASGEKNDLLCLSGRGECEILVLIFCHTKGNRRNEADFGHYEATFPLADNQTCAAVRASRRLVHIYTPERHVLAHPCHSRAHKIVLLLSRSAIVVHGNSIGAIRVERDQGFVVLDLILVAASSEKVSLHTVEVVQHLQTLGFTINWQRSFSASHWSAWLRNWTPSPECGVTVWIFTQFALEANADNLYWKPVDGHSPRDKVVTHIFAH